MGFDDYKVVIYRNQPDGWVAEIPAIPGCHALMLSRDEALRELAEVFAAIAEEYQAKGMDLPAELPCVGRAGSPPRVV
jgi:predicted RNase H-like HicB family nuclease